MSFLYFFSLFVFMFICCLLSSVILLQESKSSGLGTSFGGGDAGSSLFGTSTADVLKKFTAWLATFFLVLCVFLSLWTEAKERVSTKARPTVIEEIQPE